MAVAEDVAIADNVAPLRPYQVEAHAAAWQAYKSGAGRALIVMATGLGKTFTAARFTRDWLRENPGARALLLVDKIDPVDQGRGEFDERLGNEFTTGVRHSGLTENTDADILFSTFDTVAGCLNRGEINPEDFGLIIVDESHHAKAETYEPVVTAFTDAFRYAMTATPDRMDGRDIRDLFGEEVYSYPLAKAIADGRWLAPVTYRVMHDNLNPKVLMDLLRRVHEGDRMVTRSQVNRTLFLESELEEVVRIVNEHQAPETKTIVFCSSIEHVLTASAMLEDSEPYYYGLQAEDGGTALQKFKTGTLRTIVVVDKLNEAVDVPDADLIVFWRCTESRTIWLQQLGRGLRKAAGKERVVVLDFVANCERVIQMKELLGAVNFIRGGGGPGGDPDPREFRFFDRDQFEVTFTDELLQLVDLLDQLDVGKFTFEEAKAEIRRLGCPFESRSQYRAYIKSDFRFYINPEGAYAEWVDWYDYLGNERPAEKFTFEEAKAEIRRLGYSFRTRKHYETTCLKVDARFPTSPQTVYAESGWADYDDYLGIERPAEKFTFEEAKAEIRRLGCPFTGSKNYKKTWRKFSDRFHSMPHKVYAEWTDWYDYLGIERPPEKFTFEEAKAEIRRLGCPFSSIPDYMRRAFKLNSRFYSTPHKVYAEWTDWYDYLGIERPPEKFTFEEAKAEIRRLGYPFRSSVDYAETYKDFNVRFPREPNIVYRAQWVNWGDYLGYEER